VRRSLLSGKKKARKNRQAVGGHVMDLEELTDFTPTSTLPKSVLLFVQSPDEINFGSLD